MEKYLLNFRIFLIFFSLLFVFSLVFTLKAKNYIELIEPYQPFGNENITQASLNSFILIVFIIIATSFLIIVIRLKLRFFIKIFAIFFPLFAFSLIFLFYSSIIFLNDLIAIALTFFLAFLFYFSYSRKIKTIFALAILLISSTVGSYLALSIRFPTLILVFIFFIIYDLLSVFFGPLKILIKSLKPRGKITIPFSFGFLISNIFGVSVGTGDYIFYSFLVSSTLIYKTIFHFLFASFLVLIGILITIKILEKTKKPLPGLPIPLSLSLLVFLF